MCIPKWEKYDVAVSFAGDSLEEKQRKAPGGRQGNFSFLFCFLFLVLFFIITPAILRLYADLTFPFPQ